MFYSHQAMFPNMQPTKEQSLVEWEGKKLRITWYDGTFTDFYAQTKIHWLSMLRFALMDKQPTGYKKKKMDKKQQ